MATYSLDGYLAKNIDMIIFGLDGKFAFWKQLSDPSTVAFVNTQGRLASIYPIVGLEFGYFRILAKLPYVLLGNYSLDRPNRFGNDVKYKSANVFSIQLQGNLIPRFWLNSDGTPNSFFGIEYQYLNYQVMETSGSDRTLINGQKFKMSSISLMYGYFY